MAVILINPFEVPAGKEDEAIAFWEMAAEIMRQAPGFISTKLHKAVAPGARFTLINIAKWESIEHFVTVTQSEEFRTATAPYMEVFPHYPGLYEVIRT